MDRISLLVILVPALPLAAAILTAVLGPRILRERCHYLVIAAIFGAFLCSLGLLNEVSDGQAATAARESLITSSESEIGTFERVVTLWTWADVGGAYSFSPAESEATSSDLRSFRIDIALRAIGVLRCGGSGGRGHGHSIRGPRPRVKGAVDRRYC